MGDNDNCEMQKSIYIVCLCYPKLTLINICHFFLGQRGGDWAAEGRHDPAHQDAGDDPAQAADRGGAEGRDGAGQGDTQVTDCRPWER